MNQIPIKSDVALVLGGHDISVAHQTLKLYHKNLIKKIIISGGAVNIPFGYSKRMVATEADAIAKYLIDANVPETLLILERRAKNTAENFTFSQELIKDKGISLKTCIVITKPYAERRALATGNKHWPGVMLRVSSIKTSFENYLLSGIPRQKIFSMMVGEIQRLERYHLLDYIAYHEIPLSVREAAKRLENEGFIDRALE